MTGLSAEPKVALVTGASQRIGAVIARQAHGQGYNVVVHYRSSAGMACRLVDELNDLRADSAISVQADFNHLKGCDQLIADSAKRWGRLNLLVNNASEFFPTVVGGITVNDIESIFSANVYAPLLLSQSASPYLQSSGGSVVNIVDVYATIVHKEHPVYCASKAALAMLTKSLAVELAPDVRVNGISPGAILWPQTTVPSDNDQTAALAKVPLQKTGTAEQIAAAVMYLASAEADFITGEILTIDGGRSL